MKANRYVAFLRAVNLGGRTVKMDQLRKLFTSMGYTGVETFIASGNVVFESAVTKTADLERQIEALLEKGFGFPIATFVRSFDELDAAAKYNPFKADTSAGANLYVAFVRETPSKAHERKLRALASEIDDFRVRGREVYWLRRGHFSDAPPPPIEKILDMPATVRNSTTVRKIATKFGAGP